MTEVFELDERLGADTVPVAALALSDLRLMDDSRFPWLILIPRRPALTELVDLEMADQIHLLEEITVVSRALHTATSCDKLNIGALGNIVRQLHIHVVARFAGDPAWPGPVWGHGPPVAYQIEERHRLVAQIRTILPDL